MKKEADNKKGMIKKNEKIEKELFLEQELSCPEKIKEKKTAGKNHREADGWWKTSEGQRIIEELNARYSDDVRAESRHTGRCDHVPFIVRYLRLYPEDDILKAAQWYENKGNEGSLKASYHAGLLYEIGHDYLRAAECFTKAANGDIMHEASFHLGLLYENGLLTDGLDIPSAIRWYKRGAMGMDRFSMASTDALKRLGVITCWAELGYDHSLMMQKRKNRAEMESSSVRQERVTSAEKTGMTVPVKKGIDWEKMEFVVLMLVVIPCLALSGIYDWARFRLSGKYRKQTYHNLIKDSGRMRRGMVKPDGNDDRWQRNYDGIVRRVQTNEDMYPVCRVSILMPQCHDIRTGKHTIEEYYSVKVPGKFHCLDLKKPETLKEGEYLKDYMSRNKLEGAITVIHDGSSVYERMRKYYDMVHEFHQEEYMGCHVELLTQEKPASDLNHEKVSWHVIELPEIFRLEKDSLTSLDDRSERIFRQYREKICKTKDFDIS